MRLIIIDQTVFKVTEKQFKQIEEKQEEANRLPFGSDLFMDEYLFSNKENYKNLGDVDFDFRL